MRYLDNIVNFFMPDHLELAEGKFMVGYTEMYAGIDCTAMLRGVEKLCLDLILQPEPLKHLIDLVFEEFPQVYNHFDRILKEHNQLSATWMNLPSFETFNVLACDFATNISPVHFEEFCMPIIQREAKLFKHNVFHLDGPGVARHIDAVLTLPNLQAINWVQGLGNNEPIMQWLPLIKKIQEAGKSVIVDLKMHELDEFIKKVDPTGILFWIPAEPSEQKDILKRVSQWQNVGLSSKWIVQYEQEKDSNVANEDSGFAANEYEHEPVPEHEAKGLKSFLGLLGFESRFHDPESCVLIKSYIKLLSLQSNQPLLRILHLSNTRISVLPEVEEFLVVLCNFTRFSLIQASGPDN